MHPKFELLPKAFKAKIRTQIGGSDNNFFNILSQKLKDFYNNPTNQLIIKNYSLPKADKGFSERSLQRVFGYLSTEERGGSEFILEVLSLYFHSKKWGEVKELYKDNIEIENSEEEYIQELDELKRLSNFHEGCTVARKAIIIYPKSPPIIRRWALHHNRDRRWPYVKKEFEKIKRNLSDELLAIYLLAIFEGSLNLYASNFTYSEDNERCFEILKSSKLEHLDNIPTNQIKGQYYYFLGRYHLEYWCSIPKQAAKLPTLLASLSCIQKSLQEYDFKETRFVPDSIPPYWLYGYESILLKLTANEEKYNLKIKDYKIIMDNLLFNEELLMDTAIQVYSSLYYILEDDPQGLGNFFEVLNSKIIQLRKKLHFKIPSIPETDNFTYHHIDIIYHHNANKRNLYHQVLDTWFRKREN